jgi:hypothetical protein
MNITGPVPNKLHPGKQRQWRNTANAGFVLAGLLHQDAQQEDLIGWLDRATRSHLESNPSALQARRDCL